MGLPGGAQPTQARLGRYELLARLATGGMGEIFLARLEGVEGFEKLYVVKRILAHLADDARFRQMLIAEARIASKMAHPNICQVFELGDSDGQLYIVMEYLEGVSLLPLMRRFSREQRPLDLGLVAGIVQQTTDAMNYAHELKDRDGEYLGIIHRDVTPSNIFLTETGVAKVLDFGIAKARGASSQTQEGTVKGKYAYMAPEQLKGGSIDRRVDIFSLGVVVYEMLALRRLFQRKTDYLTFRAVMEQPIPDIRRYREDVPDGVVLAMLRAVDRDPRNRFDNARQFGTAVLDALNHTRPWSQGEIGDFVCHNFAAEIGKRSEQVAIVAGRTKVEVSSRATMPMLSSPDDDGQHESDSEDDDGFPSVETDVEGAPPWMPRPTPLPPLEGAVSDFAATTGSGTPPPFGTEPTGHVMPSLQPVHGARVMRPEGHAPPVVFGNKRGFIWPVIAAVTLAIAGGSLLLVYKQMQDGKPAEINITQESAVQNLPPERGADPPHVMKQAGRTEPAVEEAPDDGDDGRDGGAAKALPVKTASGTQGVKKAGRAMSYDAAIAAKKPDMVACFNDHRDSIPKDQITAAISIRSSGKATSVELTPAVLAAAPLGQCLRNVLMAGNYPSAPSDNVIKFPLKPKS